MNVNSPGRQIKGILESGDLSTAAPVVWYDAATQEVFTPAASNRIIIYLISVSNGDSAAIVQVFDDLDADGTVDAGEQLFGKSMNAKEQAGFAYVRGLAIKRTPKVIASGASANTKVMILADVQE